MAFEQCIFCGQWFTEKGIANHLSVKHWDKVEKEYRANPKTWLEKFLR